MRVAAVIPVLDEEDLVAAALDRLGALAPHWERVVVDGGSADRTVERARARAHRVLAAPRGRGTQLDAGARATDAEGLVFLHVDVRLPPEGPGLVEATLADPRWVGGAFRVRHVPGPGAGPLVRHLVRVADLRSRFAALPYGDQALFVRRDAYLAAGGYPAIPLMEDIVLARRLRGVGALRRLPATVEVSARRFERAPVRTCLAWNTLPLLHRLGVPPEVLARLYG